MAVSQILGIIKSTLGVYPGMFNYSFFREESKSILEDIQQNIFESFQLPVNTEVLTEYLFIYIFDELIH